MNTRFVTPVLIALSAIAAVGSVQARTLTAVQESGSIHMCAHPNSLPFASSTAKPPGFEIELGRALAKQLGVSLAMDWILITYQLPRTDCDIILDTISAPDAPPDFGMKLSKPYYRSGVVLAVPAASPITSFAALNNQTKVGVLTGSLAAMTLDKRHVPISIFGFDEDALDALADGQIAAAAVSPISAGYYNASHPGHPVTVLPPDESEHDLVWNVAVGMRRPDQPLHDAIDTALDHLAADGTINQIYAHYGVALQPPR
ncbi:MAG TPA: transporter substrate-binding domain-containing protein [Acetobacteraceae bacterium]|nr:transporter substrate-binding domain-containing protein [Acetobacteraceae bacterium]